MEFSLWVIFDISFSSIVGKQNSNVNVSNAYSDPFRPPPRSGATLELKDFLPNDQADPSFNFFLMESPFKLIQ
jgi:hypothetical protein